MPRVHAAIIYASRYGHTKLLAEAVRDGFNAVPSADAELFNTVEAANALATLDRADAIIFGAPTYLGNMASEMKIFLELAVERWFKQTWQNKIAGGFTNSSNFSGDKLNTLQGLVVSAMQFGMIWVGVGDLPAANVPNAEKSVAGPGPEAINRNSASLGPMACSFAVKAPAAPPKGDIECAFSYGKRLARVTLQFADGRKNKRELSPSVFQM